MPASRPPRGKPPEPSNRLPSFNLSTGADLFDQVCVGDALPVSKDIDAAGISGTLCITPENDGRILLIQLHRAADPPQLLTSHKRGAGATEGIQYDGVLLGAVADGIAQEIQRLGGGVVLVPLWLIVVPDGGLFAVGVPSVLAVLKESIQDRLVLPLVVAASQHQGILHPDTYAGQMQASIDKCPAEVQSLRIG